MNDSISINRADLIARLREKLPEARKADDAALAEHSKLEREYLIAFKKACKDAAKWDYQTAKEHHFEAKVDQEKPYYQRRDRPSCPVSQSERVKRAIRTVEASSLNRFCISRGGKYHGLHTILVGGATETRLCEE